MLTGPTAGWRGSNPGARRHRLCGLCGRGGAWALACDTFVVSMSATPRIVNAATRARSRGLVASDTVTASVGHLYG